MELIPFVEQNWIYFAGAFVLIILIIANEINAIRSKKFIVSVAETLIETDDENAIIIDLRSNDDFKKGHIPTAINIPFQQIEEKLADLTIYNGKKIILCAGDDARANQVCMKLRKDHQTDKVFALSGGVSAWTNESLPLAKGKK